MLYFEDLEVGHTRALGGFELLEPDVVSFARQWDPQPWHIDAAVLRLRSVLLVLRRPA
jgi:acyl dehydratase